MPCIGKNLIHVREKNSSYFMAMVKSSCWNVDLMNYQNQKNYVQQLAMSENRIFVIVKTTLEFRLKIYSFSDCIEIEKATMMVVDVHKDVQKVVTSKCDPNYVELASSRYRNCKILNCHTLCKKCSKPAQRVCVDNANYRKYYREIRKLLSQVD
jgi:hypothetical protein